MTYLAIPDIALFTSCTGLSGSSVRYGKGLGQTWHPYLWLALALSNRLTITRKALLVTDSGITSVFAYLLFSSSRL